MTDSRRSWGLSIPPQFLIVRMMKSKKWVQQIPINLRLEAINVFASFARFELSDAFLEIRVLLASKSTSFI
jgi:hypothetical protein